MNDHLRVETKARCNKWDFVEAKRTGMLQIEGEPAIYTKVASIRKRTKMINAFFHVSGRMLLANDELGKTYTTAGIMQVL